MEDKINSVNEIDVESKEDILEYLSHHFDVHEDEVMLRSVVDVIHCMPTKEKREEVLKAVTDNNVLSNPRLASLFLMEFGIFFYARNSAEQIAEVNKMFQQSLNKSANRVVDDLDGKMQVIGRQNVEAFEEAVQLSINNIYKAVVDLRRHQEEANATERRILELLEQTKEVATRLENYPERIEQAEQSKFKNTLYAENTKSLSRIKEDVLKYVKQGVDMQWQEYRSDAKFTKNLSAFFYAFVGAGLASLLIKFIF